MNLSIGCGVVVISLSTFFSPIATIAQSSDLPPTELIRRVVQNELKAERQDDSHWMFRLETETRNGQKEVDEVVETRNGDLKLPIQINGREVSAKQRQNSEQQLGRNSAALRKSLKDKNEDSAKSQQMMEMLPNAFTFNYGEHKGDLVQLVFKPNPNFHPRSHEAEVFHAMEGTIWVNDKQNRLAEISGHLIQNVKFGGGLLGHLDKGGIFDVKQQEIAQGYWELTFLNVQMTGKALFFKTISVHEKYLRTEFRRVPGDLSAAQAAEMLKKQALSQVSQR